MSLETKLPQTNWANLLRLALPAIDEVERTTGKPINWTLGGGTALAIRINHRLSEDVDIFVANAPLKLFVPAQNTHAKAISDAFQWPGHYLKFQRDDGEIDFLSSQLQTTPGYTIERFDNRAVPIETLDEVIVKKIRYRASRFTHRDAFDLAAVANAYPQIINTLLTEVPDKLPELQAIIKQNIANHKHTAISLRALPPYQDLAQRAWAAADNVIDQARASMSADHSMQIQENDAKSRQSDLNIIKQYVSQITETTMLTPQGLAWRKETLATLSPLCAKVEHSPDKSWGSQYPRQVLNAALSRLGQNPIPKWPDIEEKAQNAKLVTQPPRERGGYGE